MPSRFSQLPLQLLGLIAPPACPACGRPAGRHGLALLCPSCRPSLRPRPVCLRCGRSLPVLPHDVEVCRYCLRHPPAFDCAAAVADHAGAWRRAVLACKHGAAGEFRAQLARLLVRRLRRLDPAWDWQAVVPVPPRPHGGRDAARPLALALARRLGLPFRPWLRFTRPVRAQRGLSRRERQENMRDAVRAGPGVRFPSTVLLVDDVLTTGATLSACARAVRRAGARRVGALTLARGADGFGVRGEDRCTRNGNHL